MGASCSHWEALPLRAEVIAIALRRNYPDLTDEIVLNEMIDSRNVLDLWSIVLGGTGIAPSAEAQAGPLATTSGPSTDS